jgi:hypothetical protein
MKLKISIPVLILTFVSCGKKIPTLADAFNSVSALSEHHLHCIELNQIECLSNRLLSYKEFTDSVYASLPEGKDPVANISADVYWGWILPDRKKGLKKLFERFGGMKLVSYTLGEPKKIMKLDRINLQRDIPLQVEFFDMKEKKKHILTSSEILKAVVEVNGQFKLWNLTYE